MSCMRNIPVFLLLFSLFISCDYKDELYVNLNQSEINDISYSFVKIEYYAVNDSRAVTTFDIPSITYFNNSGVEQSYSFDPFQGFIKESSLFKSEDYESFNVKDLKLFVPVSIDESGNIYLGDKKWEYSSGIRQHQSSALIFSMDVIVPANKTAVTNAKLFYNQYKANYKLFLKGNQTGKEKIIEGIWTGIYPDHFEGKTSLFDL